MNRGSLTDLKGDALKVVASMRPRFMNRGSPWVPCGVISMRCSFNEAPIHESGKCQATARSCIAIGRLNEAPIHESGKYDRRVLSVACDLTLQ